MHRMEENVQEGKETNGKSHKKLVYYKKLKDVETM